MPMKRFIFGNIGTHLIARLDLVGSLCHAPIEPHPAVSNPTANLLAAAHRHLIGEPTVKLFASVTGRDDKGKNSHSEIIPCAVQECSIARPHVHIEARFPQ